MISDKHFVEFYSPGLIVSEVSCKPIDSCGNPWVCGICDEQKRSH